MHGDAPVVSAEGAICALASFHAVKSAGMGQPLGWLTQPGTWLLVIVRELGIVPGSIAPEGLKLLFGLTRAEARLAAALASGSALDDVARSIGISRETARAQLKAIFAKTKTNRQAELVALLARLARCT